MPNVESRPSLTTDLLDRYNKQHTGGAYDAKQIPDNLVDAFMNTFADGFTKGGQYTNFPKQTSILALGVSTHRYSPS